ncbi:integrase [Microvirga aerophila]|uniref:Integrase n=1 Tax=Microvirga aerophila TaxID=670291 RepID=A0A512BNK7_9HYPH|nr:integrase [Microvirga aerophila]GEO13543.1 hypothetical protein MAE02_12390 [Microvirga aerophila]
MASQDHELYAPGLKRMKRHNGRIDLYWVADEQLVKKGYTPKTVRLFGDWNNPHEAIEIAARCRILSAEMLEWAGGAETSKNMHGLGTIAWVAVAFETDEDSPYHEKRRDTQIFYSRYIKIIVATVGKRLLSEITGRDVRRWHKNWVDGYGERSGYACVQTLRRIVSYGCELRDANSIELANVLKHTEFTVPKGRKKRPTYDQIIAFREAAVEASRPSLALALTLQFDLGLRQKDVIGEWVKPKPEERERIKGAITDGAWIWEWGLTWRHIDGGMILKKPTSKSNGSETAEHDLKLYPDMIAALGRVPSEHRVGAIILDEGSGKPWKKSHFSRTFRKIARKAGWPDDVWNMDSRAGAVSEAFEAGAQAEDVMKAASHTQLSTTMRYNRGKIVQTSRVAELRVARRNKDRED